MSARSEYLLQRDVSREETELGKKAAEAGDYLAREKTSSQIGGAAGSWLGVAIGGALASNPLGWMAAAGLAGAGYMMGAKVGEELSEAKLNNWKFQDGEDKYSDAGGEFHRDLRGGKFIGESKRMTSDSIMEAKKGTDIWGGIGKGALMSAAVAGYKYGAVDDIKNKIKAGNFKSALPEGLDYSPEASAARAKQSMLDKIKDSNLDKRTFDKANRNRVLPTRDEWDKFGATRPKVIAKANPRASLTMPDETLYGIASGPKHPQLVGGVRQNTTEQITDAVSSGLNQGAEEFVDKSHAHFKGGLYKAVDDGATTQFNPYGVTPEMEKGLTTRGQEVMDGMPISNKNLAGRVTSKVTNQPNVPAYDQSGVYAQGNDGLVGEYQTGSKTVDLKGDYLSNFGETRNPSKAFDNLDTQEGFAGDIDLDSLPQDFNKLALSPEELKKMNNEKVMTMWNKQKSEMGLSEEFFSGEASEFSLGKRKAAINSGGGGMDYENPTMARDLAKTQNLKGATDVSVNPSFDWNNIFEESKTAQQAGTSENLKLWETYGLYDPNSKKTKLTQFMNQYNTARSGAYQ